MESTELRRDDDVLEEMESCRALTEMGNSLACFQFCECGFPPREMAFPSHNYSALSKLNLNKDATRQFCHSDAQSSSTLL